MQTKIDDYTHNDNNDSIIAVDDIPRQPNHAPLVVNNTNDENEGTTVSPLTSQMMMMTTTITMTKRASTTHWRRVMKTHQPTNMNGTRTAIKDCRDHGTRAETSQRSMPIAAY